jgi:hypothetical protein
MNYPDDPSLDQQLAKLSRDLTPPRDLWPQIESSLTQRAGRGGHLWQALAAGVACACIASALTWAIMHRQASAPGPRVVFRAPSFEEPTSPRYIAARASLEANFAQRLTQLDPSTRTKIEASLQVIRQAHEDIRQELLQHPESPVLEQLWQSTWHDELDLYDNVVQATEPTLLRI